MTPLRTALEALRDKWRQEAAEYPVATDSRAAPAVFLMPPEAP